MLLVDPGVPALAHRLREEIEALGLDVELVPEQEPPEPLDARARAEGALAAIRITSSGSGAVEMTIVDRATGKIVSRRLAISTPNDPAAAELIATRTVELLRASLMELSAEHPSRGDVPVPAEVEALAPSPAEPAGEWGTVSLGAGPALVYQPDFGFAPDAWLTLTLVTKSRVGVTAQLLLPLAHEELATSAGQVTLLATQYRLGAVLEAGDSDALLTGRFQAGLLLARLDLSGVAEEPYFVEDDALVAWGPWLGGALLLRMTPNFGALLGVEGALGFPRTVIRSAGREVSTWGRPVCTGRAGLELSWH